MKCADNVRSPDCRAPSAPAGVLATPRIQQVELSWDQVKGATRYHVFVAHQPGVTEDSTEIADIADISYTHTYLDQALTYYYRVSAENPWAEGPLSVEVSVTPLPPPPEEAPGSVAATAGDTEVEVTWDQVAAADGYHLYWDTTASASGNLVDDAESPYVHPSLENGTTYYYRVSAFNAGGEGPLSVEVSAVPQVPAPGVPRNLAAVAGDGKVTLSWTTQTGASSYTVYWDTHSPVSTASHPETGVPGSPYVHPDRANGTTYYYRVSAINPGGESALSSQASATPQPPAPATPSFLQAQPGGHEVVLSWGSAPGAETYELFWDTQPGVAATDNSFADITATEFMHSGLSKATTYYYRVRARNAGGASSLSQEVSAELQPQSCTLEGACPTGFCRDGYCCDSDCAGVCQSCDGAENRDGNGFCSNTTFGNTDTAPTALCDSSGTGCVTDDCACDGSGSCRGTDFSIGCTAGGHCLSNNCSGANTCGP